MANLLSTIITGGSGTTPTLVLDRNIATPSNYYNGLQFEVRATSGTAGIGLHRNGYSHVGIYHDSTNELKFNMNSGTPVLLSSTGTIWGSGNDGAGSGLDADLLDGQQGSYYQPASTAITTSNIGSQSVSYATTSGTANIANYFGGFTAYGLVEEARGVHSFSDFVNGTLVTTDINASEWAGDSFVMEVSGKSYGSGTPFKLAMEGYLYANTIINVAAMSYGSYFPSPVKVMNLDGNLAFWWPRGSYWNSFEVHVRAAGGESWNRVTGISDSADPASATKKISVTPVQVIHTNNIGSQSVNYAASAGTSTTSTHLSGRTDSEWYNVVWGAGNPSYMYSADSVRIRSSDGALRANIYYDNADTNYFLDPNSTSVLNRVYTAGRLEVTYNTDRFQMNFLRSSGSNWWVTNDSDKLGLHLNNVGDKFYFGTGGDFWSESNGWLSTALAGKLSLSGGTMSGDIIFPNDTAVALRNAAGNAGFRPDDQWGNTYTWNQGGGYYVDATSYFLRNSTGSTNWMTISGGTVQASSDFRAPIFYDSNDTGYYLDPNGTSNLLQLTTATRARWNMPRTWYDRSSRTSDQGYWTGTNGWAAADGTWANAWQGGFSGWDIWGEGIDHPQSGQGYVHAQGIVSGQHYATSSVGYGWMMVGAHNATANRYWLRGKWDTTTSSWVEMITTGNIGSQSVSYATSAGDSTNLGGRSSSRYLYYRGVSSSGDFQSFQSAESIIRFDQVNDYNGLSNPPGGYTYGGVLSMRGDNFGFQLWGSHTGNFYFKTQWNNDQYSGWREVIHSANIGSYALTSLPSHNHDDRYLVKGGGWYGSGLPGSRWGGFSVSGGEIVFGDGLPNAGQMGILIDGAYLAGENNGFWSLASDNSWSSRRGMYWDGSNLNFTTNSPIALFSDVRAPIFYDSQNTGYYLDPNSTSNIVTLYASTLYGSDVYTNGGWFRNHSNNNGIYWSGTGWHLMPENGADFRFHSGSNSESAIRMETNGTTRGYVYADSSNTIGFLNQNRTWRLRAHSGGAVESFGDFRAPIFYDSDNTGYYGDFASTSVMNAIRLGTSTNSGTISGGGDWGIRFANDNGWIQFGPANNSWTHIYTDKNFYFNQNLYVNGTQVVLNSGTWGINISGNAASASSVAWSNVSSKPANWLNATNLIEGFEPSGTAKPSGFYESYLGSGNPTGTWFNFINVRHSNPDNGHGFQIGMSYYDNNLWFRSYQGSTSPSFQSWSRALGTNTDPYPSNMDQYVRTSDSVTFSGVTSPTILVNNHSDNTKGYRIHNTSGSSVSAMFTNSSNQLVIAAGAVDQINLNKKVYVNGVALGVNVAPSATAGRIDASNDIVAYSSSDERLKENITPIENALDKVKSLTGVEFDWKPEYKHAHGYEGHDTGIIAQQVEAVMPSAVRTNDTGFLAVRYEKLIGLLIEGMKEQQAQIDELKAKLDGLTK